MANVPPAPTPVNRSPRRARTLRLLSRGVLIVAGVVAFVASTGAAVGPGSSRAELIAYSLGSALAVIMAIRIAVKLFVYIIQTAALLALFLLLYVLASFAVNAVSGG